MKILFIIDTSFLIISLMVSFLKRSDQIKEIIDIPYPKPANIIKKAVAIPDE